jgi:hypothetical protein
VIEGIGAAISIDLNFVLEWAGMFPTHECLAVRVAARLLPYLEECIRQSAAGWRLAFKSHAVSLVRAQQAAAGNCSIGG